MSSGITHVKASLFLSAGFAVGAMVTLNPQLLTCCAGSLAGVFITPDLDLSNEGIVQGGFIKKKFGSFVLRVWKLFWGNYSSSAKHGSWISHFPVFSTFVRLTYIYFLTILPFYTVYFLILGSVNYYPYLMSELQWWGRMFLSPLFFYGLAGSDLIHYVLDKLTKNVE